MNKTHDRSRQLSAFGAIRALTGYMVRRAPRQLIWLSMLMTFASITEGVSLLLLLPVLKLIDPAHPSRALTIPTSVFAWLVGPSIIMSLAQVLVLFVMAIGLRATLVRQKDVASSAFLIDLANLLRNELFGAVSAARWSYLVTLRQSDVNHAVTADIDRVQLAASSFLQILQTGAVLLVYTGVALILSPFMTGVALLIGAVLIMLLSPVRRLALRYGSTLTSQRQDQYRIVSEFLGGLKIAKATNTEPLYVGQLTETLTAMRNATIRFIRLYSIGSLIFQVGTAIAIAAFVWIAVGRLALGYSVIIALVLLFVRIGPRVAAVHGSFQNILTNLPALFAMLDLRDESGRHAELVGSTGDAFRLRREIGLHNISFSYGGEGSAATLDGLTLQIQAYDVTAIVGPSGSGKSTLADLLMGLLEPSAGSIVVDGCPITDLNRRAWRNSLAYVPQESFLLHDSIEANLRLGRLDLSEAQLWQALEVANAGFVRRLPQQLATTVGDRGVRLSGGERQRIALARALLREPQLLVLDEATSALDWESQAAIAESIRALRGAMTIITIAHRPSMIAFADSVIAIDGGRVVDAGSFADLASKKDGYLRRVLDGDR